jgi:hypothetical protein
VVCSPRKLMNDISSFRLPVGDEARLSGVWRRVTGFRCVGCPVM